MTTIRKAVILGTKEKKTRSFQYNIWSGKKDKYRKKLMERNEDSVLRESDKTDILYNTGLMAINCGFAGSLKMEHLTSEFGDKKVCGI